MRMDGNMSVKMVFERQKQYIAHENQTVSKLENKFLIFWGVKKIENSFKKSSFSGAC
jgi:hypothetical protein